MERGYARWAIPAVVVVTGGAWAGDPAAQWVNPAGGMWGTAGNWAPAVVPNASDVAVTIGVAPAGAGYQVELPAGSTSIGSLTLQGGGRALRFRNNSRLFIGSGAVVNDGLIDLAAANNELRFDVPGFLTGAGEVRLGSGGRVQGLSAIGAPSITNNPGHTISGTGQITVTITNSGRLTPGLPIGTLRATADALLMPSSMLEIQASGLATTPAADRLAVTGFAFLAGTLALSIADSERPAGPVEVDVLTAGTVLGQFAAVDTSALPPGVTAAVLYQPGRVRVRFSPCPADLSAASGELDINDILTFANAFNMNDPLADFFGDGMFDINDILAFAGLFNAGCE